MKKVICSIQDKVAAAWLPPMFFQSKGQALRSFVDVVNDQSSEFFKHPEDYVLFLIGDFDERTGVITVADAPTMLALGSNVLDGGSPNEDA